MTIWEEIASAAPTEKEGFRLASLRWFLRFYQRLRPEVVAELQSRARPLFLHIMALNLVGQQPSRREQEIYRETLWQWMDDFGLPKSQDMEQEAILTLFYPLAHPSSSFLGNSLREFFRGLKGKGSIPFKYSYPFITFQAPGWTPAEESIEEAATRLKAAFEKTLSEHTEEWHKRQRIAADLYALWKRDRKHIRNIRWLAHYQAVPDLSVKAIAERTKGKQRWTPKTVWRGLHSAADCLGFPRVCIRQARRGRPRSRSV